MSKENIINEMMKEIIELKERVSKMEGQMDIVLERLDRIESKLDKATQNKNSQIYKYATYWLLIILSFLAALFGIGWRPPS